MKNSIFAQQINDSSDLTYGGAALAVIIVLVIFGSVAVWVKKSKLA